MVDRQDDDHVEEAAQRENERAEHTEETLEAVDAVVGNSSYPTNASELNETYGNTPGDLRNETESLGDVFDRMAPDQEYETEQEAREAVLAELEGESGAGPGDRAEYSSDEELDALDSEREADVQRFEEGDERTLDAAGHGEERSSERGQESREQDEREQSEDEQRNREQE
ncbi:hypothetical protein [Halobacterium zhouii]|uniref:DUF5789 family protein n=1 Tax=Halobacterium zhouii TaxID=2902624 RepID=UPI001E4F31B9|nr:hypothetical protein [Halobacterium zhouii]